MLEYIRYALVAIGFLVVLRSLVTFLRFLIRHFGGLPADLLALGAKSDGWAVVTGASDGIGKAYAFELAKRGFQVLLISRTQSKLDAIRVEITEKFRTNCEILAIDFANVTESDWQKIGQSLAGKRIGVLVNNVGVNYDYPKEYLQAESQEDEEIININIRVTLRLTRMVLPLMVERKSGAIINLSSLAGRVPSPMRSTYSGSKAFIDFFSKCLAIEYKDKGIIVQCVTPSMVVSNMSKIRKASLSVCSPEHIAKRSVGRLGYDLEISPFYTHAIMIRFLQALPESYVLDYIYNLHRNIQKKALAKKARTN